VIEQVGQVTFVDGLKYSVLDITPNSKRTTALRVDQQPTKTDLPFVRLSSGQLIEQLLILRIETLRLRVQRVIVAFQLRDRCLSLLKTLERLFSGFYSANAGRFRRDNTD